MNPQRFVPLSVRHGNRRKKFGWWVKNRRHDTALRIAPWLDTGTLPPARFRDSA